MSADLVVPTTTDLVRDLPSTTLYELEQAGQLATEILDERVIAWTEEGKTQQWIAKELGCDQSTVSDRQRRLGVQPKSPRGRPRKEETNYGSPIIQDAEEVEPTEVLPPEPVLPDGPAHFLPDVVSDDANNNLRTQALHWFEQGRVVLELLENGVDLEPRSTDDRRAIKSEADLMIKVARTLRRA